MFRGIYSAATGMEIAGRSNEITAHNVAHSTVAGYRQRGVVYETFERALTEARGEQAPERIGSLVALGYTDHRPGPIQQTGAPYDLAINGDGFFAVQGPNGTLYSRDGVFLRAANGQLVNTGGYPILGTRGPITIPAQATNIAVASDGNILADGIPVDRLQLVRFNNPARLEPVGTTLFLAPPEAGQAPSNATILQGFREQSNVQLPNAMVNLIRELRYFEASQRALRALSDSVQQITRA
jgi:flagellar basal body rod protein FlgG